MILSLGGIQDTIGLKLILHQTRDFGLIPEQEHMRTDFVKSAINKNIVNFCKVVLLTASIFLLIIGGLLFAGSFIELKNFDLFFIIKSIGIIFLSFVFMLPSFGKKLLGNIKYFLIIPVSLLFSFLVFFNTSWFGFDKLPYIFGIIVFWMIFLLITLLFFGVIFLVMHLLCSSKKKELK